MINNGNILSQSSFGFNGYGGLSPNFNTPLYSYESNTSNYSHLEDWGLSLIYGVEFSEATNSNIYSISLAKTLNRHNLSARYTPGYQKEFIFNTGEAIIIEDNSAQSLTASFTYKELFGLGYSYNFSEQFNVGTTFRFFTQDFNQEIVTPVFEDTLFLIIETQNEKINFWKADIGVNYIVNEYLNFSVASINLLNFGEKAENSDFEQFEIKRELSAMFGLSVMPISSLAINFIYETTNSYQLSINGYREEL